MRRALLVLGALAVLVVGAWLLAFGPAAPCDAMRAELRALANREGGDTRRAITAGLADGEQYSALFCVGVAARLRLGDTSVIKVVKAK